ncbi:hypothetical protein LB465_04160 [Salegentibacter sp. LM13S]|uniref:hypothetical protein n=1 Tax=Salegentibacter lacus TaxID=2873599 RepID=UPI001CCB3FE4|nr:hypothetical protein [Salegentibacter lacus]MBZ9629964.1 hypothetical protein [Salegentibacter lacus]
MEYSRNLKVLFVFTLIAFSSCNKEESEQIDNLEQVGVLGQWKLEIRVVNGISSLAAECCDYIEFQSNSEPNDLIGEFRAFGAGYETNGIFELNTSNNTIQFDYDTTQKSYGFQILDDVITFTYSENNQNISEDWRKEENPSSTSSSNIRN